MLTDSHFAYANLVVTFSEFLFKNAKNGVNGVKYYNNSQKIY